MYPFGKPTTLSSTGTVDIIEKRVYAHLKPLGFRKHGRILHRFVDGDISQVIHFQNACPAKGVYDILWINLGIRVPESEERTFCPRIPPKKYYHEYECNIRTRLGSQVDKGYNSYSLKIDPELCAEDIIRRLDTHVLPFFDKLNSRDAILLHRKDYPEFDSLNHRLILLEESFIHGRRGDTDTAVSAFRKYYFQALAEYEHAQVHGTQVFLRKFEKITYLNRKTNRTETIEATEDGYVTLFNANRGHLEILEQLAQELRISLDDTVL